MAKQYPCVAACDIGNSKVAILICEVTPSGLEVVGFGSAESQGIRKATIVHLEAAQASIERALRNAESRAKRDLNLLICGVSGCHVESLASSGMIPIRDRDIRKIDIQKVLEAASAVQLPLEKEIIQVVPQHFRIDGQEGVKDPIGMYGRRLEVDIQLITGSVTILQNMRRALQRVGLEAQHFISTPCASARAVLKESEKESGVCLVDIGASTSDLALYQDGVLKALHSIPLGGMHLTNDLAVGLKTSLQEAEELKLEYGCFRVDEPHHQVRISGLAGEEPRYISQSLIPSILEARMDEILSLIKSQLAHWGVDEALPSGVVLTGGAALMKNLIPSAQNVFRLPVRVGKPERLGGLSEMISNPGFASLVGLVQLGFEENEEMNYFAKLYQKKGLQKVQSQVGRWLKDFF